MAKGGKNNSNTTDKKNILSAIFSLPDAQASFQVAKLPSSRQLPHLNPKPEVTRYQIPPLAGQLGSAHPAACEN